jgi:hypothetical protein
MMPDSAARRKRNLYAGTVVVLAIALLVSIFMWGTAAAQRSEVAQSNAQTLAEQVKQACSTGQLVVDDRNLCEKAGQIAASPDRLVPGPPGPQGADGRHGIDGTPGPAGVQGAAGPQGPKGDTGATGPEGTSGPVGAPGSTGQTGATGADSTVPGPAGPQGATGPQGPQGPAGVDGTNGTNGTSPTSFTFTWAGQNYTCTPNPPGSSTYTCAAQGGLLP